MGASRQFVDSFGFSWHAVEISSDAPGGGADGWLYFLSRGTTRRLRAYPPTWESCDWAGLEDLCGSAEVVGTDAGARPVRSFEAEGARQVAAAG